MSKRVGMNCPHCDCRAQIRTSHPLTQTMREVYFLCTNLVCGHSWVAHMEAVRTISPSGVPNPSVNLPISEREEVARIDSILKGANQRRLFNE